MFSPFLALLNRPVVAVVTVVTGVTVVTVALLLGPPPTPQVCVGTTCFPHIRFFPSGAAGLVIVPSEGEVTTTETSVRSSGRVVTTDRTM